MPGFGSLRGQGGVCSAGRSSGRRRNRRPDRRPDPEPPAPSPKATGNEGPRSSRSVAPLHVSTADRRAIDRTLDRVRARGRGAEIARHRLGACRPGAQDPARRSPPGRPATRRSPTTPCSRRRSTPGGRSTSARVTSSSTCCVHAQPASHLGSYVFSGQVVKQGDQWLVNRIYTIAIMNPVTKKTARGRPGGLRRPAAQLADPERRSRRSRSASSRWSRFSP